MLGILLPRRGNGKKEERNGKGRKRKERRKRRTGRSRGPPFHISACYATASIPASMHLNEFVVDIVVVIDTKNVSDHNLGLFLTLA